MTVALKPMALFKSIPSERYTPYRDRHIPIHARNMEVSKKRLKTEKNLIEKETLQKNITQYVRVKKIETAINNYFKLLNVI